MSQSSSTHHIIYVPGLGDERVTNQARVVRWWQYQKVTPHLYQMNWADKESFSLKFGRLLSLIERLHAEGSTISLVGASAGASVVLNAYAARPSMISSIVCICGKIQNPQTVSRYTYEHNPAFYESMQSLATSLAQIESSKRRHILSLHPFTDASVPPADTLLPGAQHGILPVFGHVFGIAYGLTLGSNRVIRFLKRAAKNKG